MIRIRASTIRIHDPSGMAVYAARDGMTYRGRSSVRTTSHHYQQVASNTLIAHARDDGTGVAALESDALGASLTAMCDDEATRQAALDAARELGAIRMRQCLRRC